MKLSYKLSKQEWKELLDYLKTVDGVYITYYARTDKDGYFEDFSYITFEYNGEFYYLEDGQVSLTDFKVCKYLKLSPYEKRQNAYPRYIHSTEDLLKYMETPMCHTPLSGTHNQRIYLTELYGMRNGHTDLWHLEYELAGNREKAILYGLNRITMVMHTKDYCVLRFHDLEGNYFDYETKSRRITG
ncbi:MAG: hypothetical protein UHD64_05700 [Bacteroidales bacterium]|nr:hypothetical protein [Bacteroidales bacterium]